MVIVKIILFVFIFRCFPIFFSQFKRFNMKSIRIIFQKIKGFFKKIYRVLNEKKSSDVVWKELVALHKTSGWNYGQFDKENRIECSFKVDEINSIDFNYVVSYDKLIFRAIILTSFDEDRTNDVLVLASHFNGLMRFGVVKVNIEYNYVEYVYYGDLFMYSIFPGEIDSDMSTHFNYTKDCFWSFTNLIETGDDPVFVFSELMRRNNKEDDASN